MVETLSMRKKMKRWRQRIQYGFDYRDIFNMDSTYAEWLYSHMRMYKEDSVHDDTYCSIAFEGKEYTIAEAVDWIVEKTGIFLRHHYYIDAHFDHITMKSFIRRVVSKFNPAVRLYLQEYDSRYEQDPDQYEEDRYKVEKDYIKAAELFLRIMGYCWM